LPTYGNAPPLTPDPCPLQPADGVTVSADIPAVFMGLWFNEQTRQTERDADLFIPTRSLPVVCLLRQEKLRLHLKVGPLSRQRYVAIPR